VIGMVVTGLYLGTVVYALVAVGHLHLQPVWLTISVFLLSSGWLPSAPAASPRWRCPQFWW